MTVVASDVSPLNCRWITWKDTLPVCTRSHMPRHAVTEFECSVCAYWSDGVEEGQHRSDDSTSHPNPRVFRNHDPLNRETCPRCASADVVLMQRDALVQSFTCSICHQRWLATRPWPLLRDTRSRRSEP
jgi:hypothetical protein